MKYKEILNNIFKNKANILCSVQWCKNNDEEKYKKVNSLSFRNIYVYIRDNLEKFDSVLAACIIRQKIENIVNIKNMGFLSKYSYKNIIYIENIKKELTFFDIYSINLYKYAEVGERSINNLNKKICMEYMGFYKNFLKVNNFLIKDTNIMNNMGAEFILKIKKDLNK